MAHTVLHHFLYSHFNEKVRWALGFKGIEHQRRDYLPGPHIPQIRKLSGQTQTPVLTCGPETHYGSAAIIDYLEQTWPTPPLYPEHPDDRRRALALQDRFDRDVGPATRTLLFAELLGETGYLSRMFARDRTPVGRALYRLTLPLARPLIAKGNGVNPANIERCRAVVDNELDQLSKDVEASGYLIGDTFSIADLTAAALVAPLVSLQHPEMRRPEPTPVRLSEFFSQWENHPACAWVLDMYARHRPD